MMKFQLFERDFFFLVFHLENNGIRMNLVQSSQVFFYYSNLNDVY